MDDVWTTGVSVGARLFVGAGAGDDVILTGSGADVVQAAGGFDWS